MSAGNPGISSQKLKYFETDIILVLILFGKRSIDMYNKNKGIMTVESLATAISAIPDLELKRKESLNLSHRILN